MAIQEGAQLQTAEIRRRLSHTWTAFFSRFGRLTEVQRRAIPLVLERCSLTVSAPTATGKTEAIVAPLAELHKMYRWQGLAVLYIVPTKALANDILSRISGPLGDIGISLALKHGDKPQLSIRALPDWLVTTPESLDSILCRKPKAVQDIEAIILDEIHLLDCTYRGDQLRILLKRLAQLRAGLKPQVCLISATLGNPQTVGARYAELCQTVAVSGSRRIEFDTIRSWTALLQLAKERSWTKILVFCNMRETVEAVADHLAALWKPYPVVVHHGSLSRSVRLEAETVMKEARIAVCVATSTLEVGIDIGNIDAVVLAEVPFSLSTLLQRIGRGNRRTEQINVVGFLNTTDEESVLANMIAAARKERLPQVDYEADLSVAVQQILSYLFQRNNGVTEQELCETLSILCNQEATLGIYEHLIDKGYIEVRGGKAYLSTRSMDWAERGSIHSNIADSQTHSIVEISSNREIGSAMGPFDQVFVFGGRRWEIVHRGYGKIMVKSYTGPAEAMTFSRHRSDGAYAYLLPPGLRKEQPNRSGEPR